MIRFLFLGILILLSANSFFQRTQLNLSDDFKIAENDDYKDQTVANSVFHNNFFYTATNSGVGGNNKWLFTKLYDLKYAHSLAGVPPDIVNKKLAVRYKRKNQLVLQESIIIIATR